jgi:hypothetical protein
MNICECGCNKTIKSGKRLMLGHNARGKISSRKGKTFEEANVIQ